MKLGLRAATLGLAAVLLAACSSTGEIDNPVQRRLSWFPFISGEDIARDCRATGRERYRLTYVADREIQVRVYDIDAALAPDAQLRTRVLAVRANDWFPWPVLTDVSRPFRPYDDVSPLPNAALNAVRDGLTDAGWAVRPPPIGRTVASHSTFWLAAGCRNGDFHFQVWEYPDPEFQALAFPDILFDIDPKTIAIAPAPSDGERRTYNAFMGRTGDNMPADGREIYNMRVEADGVVLVH